MRRPTGLALIAALSCSACGEAGGDAVAADVIVRDSAGITIVENPAPPDSGGALALAAQPELVIGVLEGAPEYQLYEAAGALRLSDGRIVVLNSGTHELRYYGPDGRFLRASGGEGGGPGEFQGMGDAWRLPGDSLLVFDWRNRRLTLVDDTGAFVRTASIQRGSFDGGYPLGVLDDMRVLMRGSLLDRMDEMEPGVQRDSAAFHLLAWRDDSAAVSAPVLTTAAGDWYLYRMADGNRRMTMYMPLLLGAVPTTLAQDGRIYQAVASTYRIDVYDDAGALRRIIRVAGEPVPATAELRDAVLDGMLADIDDETERGRRADMYADMPLPEFLPAHARMMVDATGRLWVQRYDPHLRPLGGSNSAVTWDVFDADGRWSAAVVVPPNFGIRDIGSDYVLGLHRDELGVEQVRLYRLVAAAP